MVKQFSGHVSTFMEYHTQKLQDSEWLDQASPVQAELA